MSIRTQHTFGYEKIQRRQGDGVSAEHVVAARPHALNGHAGSAPDYIRLR